MTMPKYDNFGEKIFHSGNFEEMNVSMGILSLIEKCSETEIKHYGSEQAMLALRSVGSSM